MQEIEQQVRREARAMTRREIITKAIAKRLSWIQAAEIIGIKPRQMRRIRWRVEHYGLEAVMDQRGGRPRRKRIKAGTIELLCRLKRDVYPDFSLRHFYEHVTEKHQVKVSYNWLRLMLQEAGVVAREPARGKYRRGRERRPMVGMLVHLDASTHEWIVGVPRQDLVIALDDAYGRILYGRFFAQEGVASTFAALDGVAAPLRPRPGAVYRPRQPLLPHRAGRTRTAEEQNGQAAQDFACSASARFWRVPRRPAAAASVRSAPSEAACRGNSGSIGSPTITPPIATCRGLHLRLQSSLHGPA